MRFSIVIPVFNTERFLSRCLDSLKAQSIRDFEVIVVDDSSPGDCAGVVRFYGDFVRYIRHERNRGAFQARFTGIVAAKGDYIVPVDPDDYLMPETLAKLDEAIVQNEPDVISYWIDYDDGTKIYPHWCRHAAAVLSAADAMRELAEGKYFTGVASKAFRRETMLRALEMLDAPADVYVNTCDDFLMLVSVLMIARRIAFVEYAGYRYFVNEESTSFTWKTRAGFRKARSQVRIATALLRRMARREGIPVEIRSSVETSAAGIAHWFDQLHRESSWLYRAIRKLLRTVSVK